MADRILSLPDTLFLIEQDRLNEAETYLLERAGQLNGHFYSTLISMAETFENRGYFLAASAVYRSPLESILERGYAKAYSHGVRYLKKLDKLAISIGSWQNRDDHNTYKQKVHHAHGRKSSFWSKYNG